MNTKELIVIINRCVEELDFVTARKYIEENMSILEEHRSKLKSNARDILEFLIDQKKSGHKPLTRQELATITAINTYASKFDMIGIKQILKDRAPLFLRDDAIMHLNKDAMAIMEGMGAIKKE
ncbi:hypothetical protein [Calidifontibacillus oryziterrae]|uniref:hypothetical protein n=1 Tax=Calidifontibacillus oryziterrae TaxID=1191699 RepID=UPI00030322AA|nr:hypothetical protein [Calidifontibacillus oryziterrae]